jgi:hypothetical protein
MLHNVYLCREKTTPPVQHRGDFWYWKLTAYGLALMRALVRASAAGFSYTETFMEPEAESIPQLVLLGQVNAVVRAQLANAAALTDWASILDHSPYLHERAVQIDTALFQREIDRLIGRILQDSYDPSGSRHYHPRAAKPKSSR